MTQGRLHGELGQALTEYLMLVGLIVAIIVSISSIIVPGVSFAIVSLVRWMSVYMTSAPS